MNRRVVLIDENETTEWLKFHACGLGREVYTLQQLEAMPYDERRNYLTFEKTDGIMLVGGEPFKYLQKFYHFGIRSENYFDCSKLRRLSIEGGAFVKVVLDLPDANTISDFLSDNFVEHRDFSWFKQKIIHTFEGAMKFLDYMESLPDDTNYGFDYEASGMAWDKIFEISGASLCTTKYGGFISFTDIRHTTTPENYQALLLRLGQFLVKRMSHVWTYNMQYEFLVSHRMLGGVDLYNLCDASVFNILDGNHLKKYSLKWTANMILQSTVWDTEFDRISDLIDSMLFEEVGKLKKDKHKVLKITQADFKNTPEWAELCRRYPNYINEFESLILEYWGNPFMCIPSEILGYYCNLDAFYTLMIYEERKNMYSEKAINTFMDNIRLAARLHSCGIPKWEEYRAGYEEYCKKQMAWGITYCAEARCKIKMLKHQTAMADIKKYNPIAAKLLKKNRFFGGDPIEITKYLLSSNIDKLDAYELGLDEGSLAMSYGSDFAEAFLDIVRDAKDEVKLKIKIDETIVKKKKIIGIISEKLVPLIGLDKLKSTSLKHTELEKYLYYRTAYDELMKISNTQLNDIENIPDTLHAFGGNMDLLTYSDYVSENYFKCKSPIENDEICKEFAELYRPESAYLASIFESTQQLNGAEHFYENLGITTVEDAYNHFMNEWEKFVNGTPADQLSYPEKVFNLAAQFYTCTENDAVKEVWSNFNGYVAQSQFFKYLDGMYGEYSKPFIETDLGNNLFFMRKLVINYLLYKKYAKVLSTYIDGMFTQTDKLVIEDPKSHVVIREADPGEPGAVTKMFAKFQCMEKSSKRWSSGYHTIVSHSDIKSTIKSYPGHLLSYFDINSGVN